MKYLSSSLPPDDLKRIYRAFAKLLHPDAGGSHTEFIILQSEYDICQKNAYKAPPLNDNGYDVRMYQNVIITFGKHKGTNIMHVPLNYCVWCLENLKEMDYILKKAMKWRVDNEM
jgi:hypothetical protein